MEKGKDQREIETDRLKLDELRAPAASSPDDTTDLSMPGVGRLPSPWALNSLGIVLLAGVICFVLLTVAFAVRLARTRAELAEAEAAAEAAAREPEAAAATRPAPAATASDAAPARAQAAEPAAPPERLLVLLTVGTRHYADKQLKALRGKCKARLAVYEQLRGRCAYAHCFSIATPETDLSLSRGCGQVKGQSLRDRADFAQ